ncbi:MAG: chalcone isomerase family protein [Gammaproteobacteria bacterium]|nr:chalcone isomerase family protein [Gammaproteobacteria bacterium]
MLLRNSIGLVLAGIVGVIPCGLTREIAGIILAEQTTLDPGAVTLQLNGAGIRSKFFVKVYVGALYLPEKIASAQQIIQQTGPWRVRMQMLYDEVSKEKLTKAWNEGFENNNSPADLVGLKPRLEQFNQLFTDVKRGDVVIIDYLPSIGTRVTLNDKLQGLVAGEDFQHALLKVWLGEDPADTHLKRAMLGEQ